MPSKKRKQNQIKQNLIHLTWYFALLFIGAKPVEETCNIETKIKYFWVSYNSLRTPNNDLKESFDSGLIRITHKKTQEGCQNQQKTNQMTLKFSLSNSEFFGKLASLRGNCSLSDPTRLQNSSYVYECENFDLKFLRAGRMFSVRKHFPKLLLMRDNGTKIQDFNSLSIEGFYLLYRDPQNQNKLDYFLRINAYYYRSDGDVGRLLHSGKNSLGPALTATLVLTLVLVGALKAQKYQDVRRVPIIGLGLTALSFLALIPIIFRGRFHETEYSSICDGLWALFPTPLFILFVLHDSLKNRKKAKNKDDKEKKIQRYIFYLALALQVYGVLYNAYFCIWYLFICCAAVVLENRVRCHNRINTALVILINLVLYYFITKVVTSPAVYKLGMLYLNANNQKVNSMFYFGVIVCAVCLVFALLAKSVENSETWKSRSVNLIQVLNVDVGAGFFGEGGAGQAADEEQGAGVGVGGDFDVGAGEHGAGED